MSRNGILCLEGDWDEGLMRHKSVIPVLELVKNQTGIPYIHRTASTRDEFRRVIEEWLKARYNRFPILYLGFHGVPGGLHLGRDEIPLTDLVEFFGKGAGRVIHFGACQTLRAPSRDLSAFLKKTQFAAISGFQHEVDWLYSCALEILILDEWTKRRITPANARVFKKNLYDLAGTLCRQLGFHLWERSRLRG
jgi:hypothetical protein